jgi:hypothetical protein
MTISWRAALFVVGFGIPALCRHLRPVRPFDSLIFDEKIYILTHVSDIESRSTLAEEFADGGLVTYPDAP